MHISTFQFAKKIFFNEVQTAQTGSSRWTYIHWEFKAKGTTICHFITWHNWFCSRPHIANIPLCTRDRSKIKDNYYLTTQHQFFNMNRNYITFLINILLMASLLCLNLSFKRFTLVFPKIYLIFVHRHFHSYLYQIIVRDKNAFNIDDKNASIESQSSKTCKNNNCRKIECVCIGKVLTWWKKWVKVYFFIEHIFIGFSHTLKDTVRNKLVLISFKLWVKKWIFNTFLKNFFHMLLQPSSIRMILLE